MIAFLARFLPGLKCFLLFPTTENIGTEIGAGYKPVCRAFDGRTHFGRHDAFFFPGKNILLGSFNLACQMYLTAAMIYRLLNRRYVSSFHDLSLVMGFVFFYNN